MPLPRRPGSLLPVGLMAGLLVLHAGCASLPPPSPGVPLARNVGRALVDEWAERSSRSFSVEGVAKVRVQAPSRSLSGTQVVLADHPDRLRAETLSPFGTSLLVLVADGSRLSVLVPGDNLLYVGRATAGNLGRFTRLPLRPGDLVGMLLGRPPLLAGRDLSAFAMGDGGWRVELADGDERQELRFDGARRLAEVRYEHRGEQLLQLAYGDFGGAAGTEPQRIDLWLPREDIRASLVFAERTVNRQFPPGTFTVVPPAGGTVVSLDEEAVSGTDPQSPAVPAQSPGGARTGEE